MSSLAGRARYARIAGLYDLLDWPFEHRYRPGREFVGASSMGLTLEIGAGTGKNFPYYSSEATVIAADLSWPMLARARRRLRAPVRALLVADAARLPVRHAAVDTVVATFVCCVQEDPGLALTEIERVLRPGGLALFLEFVEPARGWERRLMRLLEPLVRGVYGVHWGNNLAERLSTVGHFDVVEVRPIWPPMIHAIVAAKRR
jgi:ubiquinone/menaquinone biosynthesis C-methylase UbiE